MHRNPNKERLAIILSLLPDTDIDKLPQAIGCMKIVDMAKFIDTQIGYANGPTLLLQNLALERLELLFGLQTTA